MNKIRKIARIVGETYHKLDVARLYLMSKSYSYRMKELCEEIETYCMFIGYPRSGHSLIGSLLDAHPNAIIAHEQDALEYIQAGFSRNQVYYLLLKNSRAFTKAGRTWHGYSYQVPNQWHSRSKELRIIGDKKGAGSVERLGSHSELLNLLQSTIDINIKFIHVTRNPYDMISTTYKNRKPSYRHNVRSPLVREHHLAPHSNMSENRKRNNADLVHDIEYYLFLCETVAEIKKQVKDADILDVRFESFIEHPGACLREICLFLEIDPLDDYLDDCVRVVHRSAHKSRYGIQWERELIDVVKNNLIDRFTFLEGYSYEV